MIIYMVDDLWVKIAYVDNMHPSQTKVKPTIQPQEDATENSKEDPCSGHKGCVSENLCMSELKGPVAHYPQCLDATGDQRG